MNPNYPEEAKPLRSVVSCNLTVGSCIGSRHQRRPWFSRQAKPQKLNKERLCIWQKQVAKESLSCSSRERLQLFLASLSTTNYILQSGLSLYLSSFAICITYPYSLYIIFHLYYFLLTPISIDTYFLWVAPWSTCRKINFENYWPMKYKTYIT